MLGCRFSLACTELNVWLLPAFRFSRVLYSAEVLVFEKKKKNEQSSDDDDDEDDDNSDDDDGGGEEN